MANLAEQFPSHYRASPASPEVDTIVATPAAQAISPQDFYRELTAREDVQRILTRLAQVKDGQP